MADYIIQKAIDRKDMSARALKGLEGKDFDIQPKYDGCHMVVFLFPDGTWDCRSATGEEVNSCEHIGEALHSVLEVTDTIAVCGEVWMPNTPFPEISGAFRRHKPQPQLLFAPFDTVMGATPDKPMEDARPYRERSRLLRDPRIKHPSLVHFEGTPLGPKPWCEDNYARSLKDKGGYDGAILHDLNAPYKVGRCRQGEVIKIKPLLELDLFVLEEKYEIGDKTGKNTLSLRVRLKDGCTCYVSTGLKQAEVDEAVQLTRQGLRTKFNRAIIAVEAMGWTEDGLLREPRFKGIRHDKAAPDF
jgi:ATP-dependent DNA ligase